MPRKHRASGFTLVELLVVVAIVGVLAAIILLSLGKVGETTRRAGCASNLRQTGALLLLYVQDNKGFLPGPLWTTYGPYPRETDTSLLVYKLHPYLTALDHLNGARPKIGIFECPSWAAEVPAAQQLNGRCYLTQNSAALDGGGYIRPFGYPALGEAAESMPVRWLQLANPGRTVAVTDLDGVNGAPAYTGVDGVAQTPVHGKVRNALFFDGHVATQPVP